MGIVLNEIIATQKHKEAILKALFVRLSRDDLAYMLTLKKTRLLSVNMNDKIYGRVGIFNLIPVKDCLNCNDCAGSCYAIDAYARRQTVRTSRNYNSELVRKNLKVFKYLIVKQILDESLDKVRPHESGDFFNQEYLDCWADIARICKKYCTIYVYTKSIKNLDFSKYNDLNNFNVIDSFFDGEKLNFGDEDHCQDLIDNHGAFLCPDSAKHSERFKDHYNKYKPITNEFSRPEDHKICMNTCKYCLTESKPCFIEHGMRAKGKVKLTRSAMLKRIEFYNLPKEEKERIKELEKQSSIAKKPKANKPVKIKTNTKSLKTA